MKIWLTSYGLHNILSAFRSMETKQHVCLNLLILPTHFTVQVCVSYLMFPINLVAQFLDALIHDLTHQWPADHYISTSTSVGAKIRVNAHWFVWFVFHRGGLRKLTCLLHTVAEHDPCRLLKDARATGVFGACYHGHGAKLSTPICLREKKVLSIKKTHQFGQTAIMWAPFFIRVLLMRAHDVPYEDGEFTGNQFNEI